jgi:hypothetical protein
LARLGIVFFQFDRALKLDDGLRQPSFLFISSTQETVAEPKVRVNLNGATELLNRRIPALCKYQSRSHAEGCGPGKWIGLLRPLGFRD